MGDPAVMSSAARRRREHHGGLQVGPDADWGGVAEIQRARMIAALIEVTRERGVGGVTVAHIVARAGVSRRTFYELFEDREDCVLAAFDLAVARAARRVLPAYRVPGSWQERIRAALCALLEFVEDEPGMATLCIVDALGAGPVVLERRSRIVGLLIDAVHEGRHEVRRGARPTRLTAEGVVGAILAVLYARLADQGGDPACADDSARGNGAPPIVALLGPLMGMIALPHLGRATAAREASRPAPRRRRVAHAQRDPLRDLDMRLTYRTVRVLLAIAEHPGASNREVGDASGVQDQGQISKLLARLKHLGLIRNASVGFVHGGPNNWTLTSRGEEIQQTIQRQAVASPAGV
jgi:AcrR family transcriptional regulator